MDGERSQTSKMICYHTSSPLSVTNVKLLSMKQLKIILKHSPESFRGL